MILPFGSAKNNLHAGLPWKGMSFWDWAMKPLLQISIVYVLINKHPARQRKNDHQQFHLVVVWITIIYVYDCHDAH
jgi:hypothetical protein